MTPSLNDEQLERCANVSDGPVALHWRQDQLPVEGRGTPFFPATFAMPEKYNIDTLSDGTLVALVDSVGSQANRMEPLFLKEPYRELVPQIDIAYGDETKDTAGSVSLLEAGHRLGDAIIRCTAIQKEAQDAFRSLQRGNAEPIARLAPTSLVFGAWDSRDTGAKLPRIVQATIRAWEVSRLTRSAQFVPALAYAELGAMKGEDELKKADKDLYAERGFLHVPSTGDHGGVIANGPIRRDVTVNLVALRRLESESGNELRRYILGLAILAAIEPQDPFLRQGCLLVPDTEQTARFSLVERDGSRTEFDLDRNELFNWAKMASQTFGVAEPRSLTFDSKLAKADMAKKKKK